MWTCSKCREEVAESFGLCWNCGTDIDGNLDISFQSQREIAKPNENEPVWTNIQFTLRDLFRWTTLASIFLAFIVSFTSYSSKSPVNVIMVVIGIVFVVIFTNLLGVSIGLVVTHVFRFPNDGSLSWDSDQSDKEEDPDSDDHST